jgi:hypothetical protein
MNKLRTKLLLWLAGNASIAVNIRFQDGRVIIREHALVARCYFVRTPRKWWMFWKKRAGPLMEGPVAGRGEKP